MQESSCNPNTVGGAGEQGLMQLTKDKCTNAPNGNCKDVVRDFVALPSLHSDLTDRFRIPELQHHDRRAVLLE